MTSAKIMITGAREVTQTKINIYTLDITKKEKHAGKQICYSNHKMTEKNKKTHL